MVPKIEKGPGGGLFYLRSGVRFAVQGAGRTFCGIDLDVFAAGMILCICIGGGGGALLRGLDQLLREDTSLPIFSVDDPLATVVMGTGIALDNMRTMREVCID